MAETFVAPVVGEAFKCSLSHLEREIRYLFYFRTNVHNLDLEVKLLTSKRDDVIRLIEGATTNDQVTREMVKAWLEAVDKFLAKATKLNGKAALIDRWFQGWVLCSRFSTGRGCQKMIESARRLWEHADAFGDRVADGRLVQDLVSLVGVLTSNGEFKTFGSRVTTAKQVIQALQDDKVSLLGIYGMPGVGKSTMISALPTYVKKHKIFDEVVVVKLTQTPEIKVIQGDIANGLGLKFEDADTLETRAHRLFARLSQPQKTLIVLDNVWRRVELSEVGIPQGLKSCKVVFTTRSQDVCNSMDTKKSRIEVGILCPDESWDLFREKAGHVVDSLAGDVARDVCNECQGLPLLIVALGRALYGKRKSFWDAALLSLQSSTILLDPVFADMPHVFSVMKLSYDNLQSEELKLCFLFCCLFPDGYPISEDQLFHYMMGEKLITKTSTFKDARIRLQAIVVNLTSSCLLVQSTNDCVMMHDVVRAVAIAIASDSKEGHGFLVKAGMIVRDWPEVDLDECKRMSFITTTGRHMTWSPPDHIKAAHLKTLSFNGNEKLVDIPADFFKEATGLLTLDLSYTGIKVLPRAITCLVNLRTLLLEGCLFKGVYLSKGLESLEILSLSNSTIESFMVSENVTSLKLLDLSGTSCLEHIRPNIISSFIKLEELYLLNSFRAWEPEKKETASSSKGKEPRKESASSSKGIEGGEEYDSSSEEKKEYAKWSEVASLTRLTSLEFHVGDLECLFQSIPNWVNLTRFKIAVGVIDDFSPFGIDDGLRLEKSMYIELDSRLVANWVKVLLGRTEFLLLKGSQSLRDLLQLERRREQEMFRDLKVLILSKIESCPSLIASEQLGRLQNLNKLVVINCNGLRKMIEFKVEVKALFTEASWSSRFDTVKFSNLEAFSGFPNLTYLRVSGCYNLYFLFPMSVIGLLSQLEELYISDCNSMGMVIETGGSAANYREILPKLRVLSLENLSSLSYFYLGNDMNVNWSDLEELTVKECGKLREVPSTVHRSLTKLIVDDEARWLDEVDEARFSDEGYDHLCRLSNSNSGPEHIRLTGDMSLKAELLDQSYSDLRSLRMTNCEGTSLMPCDLLRSLSNLEKLVVHNWESLEKMIDFGGEEKEGEERVSFVDTSVASSSASSIKNEEFSKLPPSIIFPNLTVLKVSRCKKLKYLFPERVVREHMLQLKEITIEVCNAMETVIEYDTAEVYGCADKDKGVFPNLTVLHVSFCKKLKYLLPERLVREHMVKLKEIKIEYCSDMEMVIEYDTTADYGCADKDKAVFPDLTALNVSNCDSLKYLFQMRMIRGMQQLARLEIYECNAIETIIEYDTTEDYGFADKDKAVFPDLTVLNVSNCDSLKYLFSMRMIRGMLKLERLCIWSCKGMEMIITHESTEDDGDADKDKAVLPKLENLTLLELQKLTSFVGQDILFDWPSLTVLWVKECLGLKKLPLGSGSVPKLETCWLDPKKWSDELQWEDQEVKSHLLRIRK